MQLAVQRDGAAKSQSVELAVTLANHLSCCQQLFSQPPIRNAHVGGRNRGPQQGTSRGTVETMPVFWYIPLVPVVNALVGHDQRLVYHPCLPFVFFLEANLLGVFHKKFFWDVGTST